MGLDRLGMAFGVSLDEADAAARAVTADAVLAYADAVLTENLGWLRCVTESDSVACRTTARTSPGIGVPHGPVPGGGAVDVEPNAG